MKETKEMQKTIEAELGLNPIEQDVIVLYEGETLEEVRIINLSLKFQFYIALINFIYSLKSSGRGNVLLK